MDNKENRPQDRLTTTDEEGRRLWLYPQDVKGWFRTQRTRVHAVLIVILFVVPWVRINGKPLILLDVMRRRFTLFGETFWATDAPFLVFLLLLGVISIMFVTSVWGRIWCGWACPQTVFIDGVFRRIERFIEGDAIERRRRDEGPFTIEKLVRKSAKWFFYSVVSFFLANTFLSYFTGTDALLEMMSRSPAENPTAFLFMLAAVGVTLFDFGWFREQFCTIVCPYGRFQSVLLDHTSMVVQYNTGRGEPRGRNQAGDCIDCNRCVKVCPTGIDIRHGIQMECIACTACIDACDDVMTRLRRPTGLIRYYQDPMRWKRMRPYSYLTAIAGLVAGLVFVLSQRELLTATVIRAIGTPYQMISGEVPTVTNRFKIHLENRDTELRDLRLHLSAEAEARGFRVAGQLLEFSVAGGEGKTVEVFIQFPVAALPGGRGKTDLLIETSSVRGTETLNKELSLVGPLQ